MSEYLSKEEIKKWRSSVEKITLEEYAARLGKKLQEEKKTNDLADMLYTHYNPADSSSYDTITKLEKIDLTPKMSVKPKKAQKEDIFENDDFDVTEDDIAFEEDVAIEDEPKPAKTVKKETEPKSAKKVEPKPVKKAEPKQEAAPEKKQTKSTKKEEVKTEKAPEKKTEKVKKEKPAAKKEKQEAKTLDVSSLNITFTKPLTDREEKVLEYFVQKKGEIVFAKDLAELLNLKRDYIYKYIKNLRAKMSTDIIVNADNGGFKID